jgi:hypothetical protein
MISRLRGSKASPYLIIGAGFVAAVIYVLAVLPHGAGRPAQPATESPPPIPHSDGLTDSFEGYRMEPVSLPEKRGKAVPVSFRLHGPDGAPLTSLQIVQAKPLHLYLVRQDISGYQHLHPTLEGDVWSSPIDIDDGGSYRLYAEFTPHGWPGAAYGDPVILGLAFVIAGDTKLVPLPPPAGSSAAGPYTMERVDGTSHLLVNKGTLLRFRVPGATLEPYLDAMAHMSAFEVRTQALHHLHAVSSELAFHAQFPSRGEYRLFIEFQAAGAVHQAAFTIFVT